LAFNKSDLLEPEVAEERARQSVLELGWDKPWFVISAVGQKGTRELVQNIMTQLEELEPSTAD